MCSLFLLSGDAPPGTTRLCSGEQVSARGCMSLVSVVIPAYNAARWIRAAIDSVLAQTVQDFEIIVSDDGSKDDTVGQVALYRDNPRIQYIFHENRGASHAKNLGSQRATGKYLAFLDA